MSIGKIGGGDNPFLDKYLDAMGSPHGGQANGIDADKIGVSGGEKTGETEGVKKTGNEEGAASANTGGNPNGTIDRSQFTKEDEMQEIDLQEFEDDF